MLEEYYDMETKTLRIPFTFKEELKDLPLDTEIIIFDDGYNRSQYSTFNKKIGNLPENLKKITFGYGFNKKVDNLPQNLTHLTFGYRFNKKVDNLPNSLTHLTFGYRFNQKVDNLPSSLTHLTFGVKFSEKVDNLPSSLTHLTFGWNFNKIVNNLPPNIKEIKIYREKKDVLKKRPFGCKIVDEHNREIFL